MGRSSYSPPRYTAALLEALLPPEEVDSILGDLEEAFHEQAVSRGVGAARRWYRGQALRFLIQLGPARVLAPGFLGRDMIRDLRFALRRLAAKPALTVVVLATLGLGITYFEKTMWWCC